MDMSLQLHILPCTSSDKLKKSFLDQLSLHVELNREASSTVSLPLIVIFRPQGRPNDEFDGVVLPFLDKGDPSCKDVILFTALATLQPYGRGFAPDCALRFKYTDKLFITSGHLDTQINRPTFTKLGDILVQEYGFKTSGRQSQGERDQGSIHLGGDQEEVNKRSVSDLRKQVDEDLPLGGDASIEVGEGDSLGGDANRLENNSARHRLWIMKKEMEGVTTDLQREVETKWKLLVQLPRILEAVLEELDKEPNTAEILENYSLNTSRGDAPPQGAGLQVRQRIQEQFNNRTAALQNDVQTRLKVPAGKLLTILEEVLKYADQDRKVTNQGQKWRRLWRK
ncbi:uncharacterized protein LOC125372516 isoform X2 [Haliotis rufescens]|uniref:uncharacterized protein LOC125372516 isoform X2 n=1 Tax=Haliotis rufescens TaxID=6454 RepID=UPI00201F791B|nr:uncharacterized protein LOC125372516 isoform X2 [Haliotis rufescens]